MEKRVEIISDFFDKVVDDKAIFLHLSRRLEKIYDLLLGRFCRILLPRLVAQYSLTREEIRLFILMNVPLRYLNYHKTTEKLIQHFYSYPNIY